MMAKTRVRRGRARRRSRDARASSSARRCDVDILAASIASRALAATHRVRAVARRIDRASAMRFFFF
jgi:hypothetical protein